MQNLSVVFVDAGGRSTIVLLHLVDGADPADGVDAIHEGSNADWSTWWASTVTTQTPAPLNLVFPDVRDKAVLTFADSGSGDMVTATIPAPTDALFLADGETVDPADPTGVIADLLAIMSTTGGVAVDTFIGGTRQ